MFPVLKEQFHNKAELLTFNLKVILVIIVMRNIYKDIQMSVCKVVVLVMGPPTPMPSLKPLSPTCCWVVIFSTVG